MLSTEELEVFKWLNEKKAPLEIRMKVLKSFELNQLLTEFDKRIMNYEKIVGISLEGSILAIFAGTHAKGHFQKNDFIHTSELIK